MTLFEELTGAIRPLYLAPIRGRRKVSFALDGEVAHEQRLVEEAAKEAAKQAAAEGKPSSFYLILAALRDGRARFESDIAEVTSLRYTTVENVLHRLRRRGEVEQTHVGCFRLWSKTSTTTPDDAQGVCTVANESVR